MLHELTPKEFKKIMILSYERVDQRKEEINKINVFPVPDQDTGENLSKTLEGIKKAVENRDFKDLPEISKAVLNGALTAAQGNAGIIYTGFLAGFFQALQGKNLINAENLAKAMKEGAARARQSIQDPKEGTILDVIDAAAEAINEESIKKRDIVAIFRKAVEEAKRALIATREKMEVFRKANVVDAGGLGYLIILESYLEDLEREEGLLSPKIVKGGREKEKPSEKIKRFIQTLSYRYEIVFLIEKPRIKIEDIKNRLSKIGNSLEVLQVDKRIKVHIHTDLPDEVKKIAEESGRIQSLKMEDMAEQVASKELARSVSIGIVVEDLSDLSQKITERYQIEIVKTIIDWPEGKNISGDNIYQKMREADNLGIRAFPKTSQPTPKAYLDAFEKQLKKFEKVLCVSTSAKLSGCYNSAKQAKAMSKDSQRIFVFDSQNISASQALLVLRAVELIQEQRNINEVVEEIKNFISRVRIYVIFEDPKWIEAGGRVSKTEANWIRRMKKINFHPLITVKDGRLEKGGIVWASGIAEALFKKLSKESRRAEKEDKKVRFAETREARRVRVIIIHADNFEGANKLKKMLKKIKAEVLFINLTSPTIGVHTGPGTLGVAWVVV